MKKIIVFISSICFFIFVLGIAGFQRCGIYMTTIIFTVFFIIFSCLISKKILLRLLLITFSIGITLFTGTIFEQALLDKKLYSFDINGDEIFSEAESTEEQQLYFERYINDTNVLFRYVIAFPYALFVSIVGILLFNAIKRLLRYIGTLRRHRYEEERQIQ